MKDLISKVTGRSISKTAEINNKNSNVAYINTIYSKHYEQYPSITEEEIEVSERGFFKNTYYQKRLVKKETWKVSSTIPVKDVSKLLEKMHQIYFGYSRDKNLKIYMDGQFAIRDIWIEPKLWEEIKESEDGISEIIRHFTQAYEQVMKEIWSQYYHQSTGLATEDERIVNPLFEGFVKLIINHFDIMDFVRELDKLNDGNFNLDIEGQNKLEQKYNLTEDYDPFNK